VSSDAILLIGFGGPEGPDEVLPFLRRVTAGKNIPDERRLPLYWGNRNSPPFIADALEQMRSDGVTSAVAAVTSAFSSFSGCRQYRQDIEAAREEVPGSPEVVKAHPFFDHPLMVAMWADQVRAGLAEVGDHRTLVLFSTHSIPEAAAAAAGPGGTGAYVQQHMELAEAVMAEIGSTDWDLCYQSRSGPPHQPWLEPDVSDRLATAQQEGYAAVVLVPLGFISDHVEVLWDLDTVAMADGEQLGLAMVRVPTIGTDERFLTVLTDLVAEYRGEGPFPSFRGAPLQACPTNCCLPVGRQAAGGRP